MRLPRPSLTAARALLAGERNRFATGPPSPQTAIETVPSDWASRLPLPGVISGTTELFADPRVDWAIAELGGVGDASCVELGPLEGGHSYMLEQAGAGAVTAVEANNNAYLKCLVVKELLDMRRCAFLYADALEYLRTTDEHFDVCWCAGFLYHMVDPVQLIELISARASRLYMWTQFYDPAVLTPEDPRSAPFAGGTATSAVHGGYRHTLHRHEYGRTPLLRSFSGGTRPHSNWLTLQDITGALEHFGWGEIRTQVDNAHQNGPAVNLVAVRR